MVNIRCYMLCVLIAVCAVPAYATLPMCVAAACLNMTVQEASSLALLDVGHLKMEFKADDLGGHGLDKNGRRVWIGYGNFDRRSIQDYARRVHTTCAADSKTAWLQSTDGNKIFVRFTPAMLNGRGTMVVTSITRVFGPMLSDAQFAAVTEQARKRYGPAFRERVLGDVKYPAAWVDFSVSHGRVLELATPAGDHKQALLAQPGCGTAAAID